MSERHHIIFWRFSGPEILYGDIPWYLGVAWREYDRDSATFAPLGLSKIAQVIRECLLWIRFGEPGRFQRLVEERDYYRSKIRGYQDTVKKQAYELMDIRSGRAER